MAGVVAEGDGAAVVMRMAAQLDHAGRGAVLVGSAVMVTALGVLTLSSLAGYGFARLDFPFRRTLFVFVMLGLAIPQQAGLVEILFLIRQLMPLPEGSLVPPA